MKRALLVSEVGAGAGHVSRLKRIAQALAKHEVECVAAIFTQTHGEILAPFVSHLLPAPGWPGLWGQPTLVEPRTDGSAPTYADMLVKLGLGEPRNVSANQRAWRSLIDLVKPDLVVGDYAPGAMIAAAGRIPAVSVGTGFTVPAARDGYILFERELPEAEKVAQGRLFASILEGAELAQRPLSTDALGAVRGRLSLAASLPEFDPSIGLRSEALVPPEVDELPRTTTGRGKDILAYFGDESRSLSPFLIDIAKQGRVVRLHARRLPTDLAASLQHSGIRLESEPFSVSTLAQDAGLFIHHGGLGVCQMAALVGVAQFAIYRTGERWSNALAIARAGAGHGVPAANLEADKLMTALEQMFASQHYQDAAYHWSIKSRQWCNGRRGQDIIADYCLTLK